MDEGTLMKRISPFLDRTKITVDRSARLFDDDDDRRLPENCCLIASKQQYDLGAPPRKTDWAI
jgi:hypothetical protein